MLKPSPKKRGCLYLGDSLYFLYNLFWKFRRLRIPPSYFRFFYFFSPPFPLLPSEELELSEPAMEDLMSVSDLMFSIR